MIEFFDAKGRKFGETKTANVDVQVDAPAWPPKGEVQGTYSGGLILGRTTESETVIECPTCGTPIRWKKYYKPSGQTIAVMFTYCCCEFAGKQRKTLRRRAYG